MKFRAIVIYGALISAFLSILAWPAYAELACDNKLVIDGRWSEEKINNWYAEQLWLVGANYLPRNAVNQLEMWQEDTFSPEIIDEELGWAEAVGMNTMRVFLHDLAWKRDQEGFLDRMDQFLVIASKHNIRPMFVIFDDVWHPAPKIGKQPEPIPHLHNSRWVQSPGKAILGQPSRHDELELYVKAVLERFGQDERVLAWDLYNEPGNMIENSYGVTGEDIELRDKSKFSMMLLRKVFCWAREANPSQPLSASVWPGAGGERKPISNPVTLEPQSIKDLHPLNQFMLMNSDFINWHSYEPVGEFAADIRALSTLGRPLFLTEYLVRDRGDKTNRFEYFMPIGKAFRVAMYHWGLVDGKSQTKYPWVTWEEKWTYPPEIWSHDFFRADGQPYDSEEAALFKRMTNSTPN